MLERFYQLLKIVDYKLLFCGTWFFLLLKLTCYSSSLDIEKFMLSSYCSVTTGKIIEERTVDVDE